MTQLAYAAVNYLLQQADVTSLVGSDELGPWIHANRPEALVENSETVLVVISVENGWGANQHNTARFPTLVVDIWADPTRNAGMDVARYDAELKAEAVYKAIDKHFHRVDNSVPGGGGVYWGTATQIADKTGVRINSSSRENEPNYLPAFDGGGACVATVRYNVSI